VPNSFHPPSPRLAGFGFPSLRLCPAFAKATGWRARNPARLGSPVGVHSLNFPAASLHRLSGSDRFLNWPLIRDPWWPCASTPTRASRPNASTFAEATAGQAAPFRPPGKCQSSLLTLLVAGDRSWGCRGNYASNIRERSIM